MTSVVSPSFAWTPYTQSPLTKPLETSSPATSIREKHIDDDLEQLPSSPTQSKFKPYLRKLSFRDQNLIDLSRPSAENHSLTGIGFYDEPRSPTDVVFSQAASKTRHQRTTSNNSNFSIGSTLPPHQRPRAPYTIPFQHTPRPYTPPISRSYTASSVLGSDGSAEAEDIMVEDDFAYRPRHDHTKRRSGSIGSLPVAQQQMIQMHSSSSLTMLNTSNYSESSLPSLPTSRSRGDTLRSIDTVGSSSRTSMEKGFAFTRGSSKDEPMDAAARAAQINAARIAFAEREEAKERKAMRQQEKTMRKRQQKEERSRRKSESNSTNGSASDEKVDFVGVAYTDYHPAHARTLPRHVPTSATPGVIPRLERRGTVESKSVKSRWLNFLAWFRTRLLRVSKKIHKKQH
jgi:hypothetical protein